MDLFGKVDRFSDNVVLAGFDFLITPMLSANQIPFKQNLIYSNGMSAFYPFYTEFPFDPTIVKLPFGFHAIMASCGTINNPFFIITAKKQQIFFSLLAQITSWWNCYLCKKIEWPRK